MISREGRYLDLFPVEQQSKSRSFFYTLTVLTQPAWAKTSSFGGKKMRQEWPDPRIGDWWK